MNVMYSIYRCGCVNLFLHSCVDVCMYYVQFIHDRAGVQLEILNT